MRKDVFLQLALHPKMTLSQLVNVLMSDFEKTKLPQAEFDIPGADGMKQFVLHFEISLRPMDTTKERKH
jgi:hypothetical protein